MWQVRGRCLGHLVEDLDSDMDIAARVLRVEESEVAQLAESGEQNISVTLELLRISRVHPGTPITKLPGLLSHVPLSAPALRVALNDESWAKYADTAQNLFGLRGSEIRDLRKRC